MPIAITLEQRSGQWVTSNHCCHGLGLEETKARQNPVERAGRGLLAFNCKQAGDQQRISVFWAEKGIVRMIIRIEGLMKLFRTEEVETTALDEVNLQVEKGEFTSIMGPSGCGKSTLLHILGLIDNPDGGKYWFLDEEVSGYSERQRANLRKENIGFVFQSFNLIDELTVYENVELPLIYTKTPAAERKTKVEAVLEKMDMGHRAKHFPQQLSGGQQQRVAVARAIVNQPNLILADEPTGNLDSEHGEEVMKILSGLNDEGTTIVMVTHSPEDAAVGKRIVRMLDGKVISESDNLDRTAFA